MTKPIPLVIIGGAQVGTDSILKAIGVLRDPFDAEMLEKYAKKLQIIRVDLGPFDVALDAARKIFYTLKGGMPLLREMNYSRGAYNREDPSHIFLDYEMKPALYTEWCEENPINILTWSQGFNWSVELLIQLACGDAFSGFKTTKNWVKNVSCAFGVITGIYTWQYSFDESQVKGLNNINKNMPKTKNNNDAFNVNTNGIDSNLPFIQDGQDLTALDHHDYQRTPTTNQDYALSVDFNPSTLGMLQHIIQAKLSTSPFFRIFYNYGQVQFGYHRYPSMFELIKQWQEGTLGNLFKRSWPVDQSIFACVRRLYRAHDLEIFDGSIKFINLTGYASSPLSWWNSIFFSDFYRKYHKEEFFKKIFGKVKRKKIVMNDNLIATAAQEADIVQNVLKHYGASDDVLNQCVHYKTFAEFKAAISTKEKMINRHGFISASMTDGEASGSIRSHDSPIDINLTSGDFVTYFGGLIEVMYPDITF